MEQTTDRVRAWRPRVPGIVEVLHAQWRAHAYPAHTHDTWTLLLVDDGLIGYELDRREHGAHPRGVTLLPPHVPHDGHAVSTRGFRKRVVYLAADVIDERLVGAAVDAPLIVDEPLQREISRLDRALVDDDDLEAEVRLAVVTERLSWHLSGRRQVVHPAPAVTVAQRARDLFDADPVAPAGLGAVADALGVSVAHLVRSFTRSFGIAPHRYLVGRRLDLARRLLLDGADIADAATASGFYDQAHLSRHFSRLLATTPGRYQRGR